ncbi:hypothetical protein LENED_006601 [Lentinula edodes]|uniref:Uncharacterized protein n=1 Tax=Lentinula edodes TaxID=5353 RepID=A0A1Q3EC54_LENED|nr:hypothetical protein LENED_006601 [Lentinula edodes]
MNTTTFAFGKLSSRESVYKLSKVLGIQPLLISRIDMARIYTTDLHPFSDDGDVVYTGIVECMPLVQDTGYVGTRADWDMMPPSARAQITQFYGGQNRSTRVDLRESYITRYKLIKTIVFFFSDLNAVVTQSSNDKDALELIHIGDEEGHNQVDYSDGVTGSSL